MDERWYVPISIAGALGADWLAGAAPMISQTAAGVFILGAAILWAAVPGFRRRWEWFPTSYELPGRDNVRLKSALAEEARGGDQYRITLTVTNPGHTDTFDAQVVEVLSGDRGGLIEFLRWQGQNNQERKIPGQGGSATLNIGFWEPPAGGVSESGGAIRPGKLTVPSSTGMVDVSQPRGEIESTQDLYDQPIEFTFRLRSLTTDRTREFSVEVSPNAADFSPEVGLTVTGDSD